MPNKTYPPGSEAGYLYDWTRQRQKRKVIDKQKSIKLKKKIDKLSAKNRIVKENK